MKSLSLIVRKIVRLPYLPVIAGPVLLFVYPLLRGETLFWGLPALQFIPWQGYALQQIGEGSMPLWNPLNGMGAPLLANYQLALWYPPNWLGFLFGAVGGTPALAWGQMLIIALHLVWAGLGMVFLTRKLGVNELGQTVSGLAFGLGGYFVARSSFYSMIWAGAWLPWIIGLISSFAVPMKGGSELSKKISFSLVTCLAMQLLAGHAQLTWYTLLLGGGWAFSAGWLSGGWKNGFKQFGHLLAHVALAAGVVAVQLLPTAEYLLHSSRSSAVDFEQGLTYSFWPWRLLTLLAPNIFGNPGLGNYWGYASFWEDSIYLGVVPVWFAMTTLLQIGGQKNGNRWQWLIRLAWAAALLSLLLALGKNTPIFPFLAQHVPTFGLFNAPARWMIWFVFFIAILGGIGISDWRAPRGKALRRLKRLTVGLLAVPIAALLTWILIPAIERTFVQATLFFGVFVLGTAVLALRMPKAEASATAHSRWRWWVSGWLLLDLLVAGWFLRPTIPASIFASSPVAQKFPGEEGRVFIPETTEYGLKFRRFFRFADFLPIEDWQNLRTVGLPNLNLIPGDQVAMVNNFDPLVPAAYARWMDWIKDRSQEELQSVYSLMDVSQVVKTDFGSFSGITRDTVPGYQRLRWFTCAKILHSDEEVWEAVSSTFSESSTNGLIEMVYLAQPVGMTLDTCEPQASGTMQITSENAGELKINVTAAQDGILFLADTWYPGWIARVDGIDTAVLKADTLFRAVPVQAGVHQVEFIYRPKSFYSGAGISAISLLFVVIFFFLDHDRVK